MMRALLVAVLALWLGAAQAQAPEGLRDLAPEWTQIGSGKMRFFGLHIYDIALWSSRPQFDDKMPHALYIRYARSITSEQFASTSIDQLRGLGFRDDAQLVRWRDALGKVFPSVKPGETILGIHQPGQGAKFYYQGKPFSTVDDAQLARAFFAIWMDEKTSEPGLRAQLLGRK